VNCLTCSLFVLLAKLDAGDFGDLACYDFGGALLLGCLLFFLLLLVSDLFRLFTACQLPLLFRGFLASAAQLLKLIHDQRGDDASCDSCDDSSKDGRMIPAHIHLLRL
jgi:hypothetical protein